MHRWLGWVVLICWCVTPIARAQVSADTARYQQTVADAVAEYDRGHWAEARALFLQAHALHPSARTLRTLGMTAFELRDYATALTELSAALEDPRRPLDERLRAEVRTLIERASTFAGRFRVSLDPDHAALSVDEHPVQLGADSTLVLGVGPHTLRATASGYEPAQLSLQVAGSEEGNLELRLERSVSPPPAAVAPAPPAMTAASAPPASSDEPTRVWTWVAAGGAIAFGASAIAFQVAADNEWDELTSQCEQMPEGACSADDEVDFSRLDQFETLRTVTAVTAGVAAAAAVVLFFVEGAEREPTALRLDARGPRLELRF